MAPDGLTLSVVIISWNQLYFLKRLTSQLLDQSLDPSLYEIVIVDDGSSDGSQEWIQSLGNPRVHGVIRHQNLGRGASRNAGIRAATGNIIVMLDGDHTVKRDFLAIHAERHSAERCVIVGKSDFVDDPQFRALNHYLNHGGATKLAPGAKLPGRYFLTRNCSVPRDLLFQIGLFDKAFVPWGGEDLDLGLRLEHTGVPIYGEPRALAIHHHLRPLNELLENLHIYGRDCVPILLQRHPQLFAELNLDRTLPAPDGNNRFGAAYRAVMRFLMVRPIYTATASLAQALRRRRLPRAMFDYLHLRQYTCGYRSWLETRHSEN
jgi:glycosyltransferase involved in cell wall biosynthesis